MALPVQKNHKCDFISSTIEAAKAYVAYKQSLFISGKVDFKKNPKHKISYTTNNSLDNSNKISGLTSTLEPSSYSSKEQSHKQLLSCLRQRKSILVDKPPFRQSKPKPIKKLNKLAPSSKPQLDNLHPLIPCMPLIHRPDVISYSKRQVLKNSVSYHDLSIPVRNCTSRCSSARSLKFSAGKQSTKQKQIVQQNMRLAEKLLLVSSTVSRKQHRRFHTQHSQYRNKLSRYSASKTNKETKDSMKINSLNCKKIGRMVCASGSRGNSRVELHALFPQIHKRDRLANHPYHL